ALRAADAAQLVAALKGSQGIHGDLDVNVDRGKWQGVLGNGSAGRAAGLTEQALQAVQQSLDRADSASGAADRGHDHPDRSAEAGAQNTRDERLRNGLDGVEVHDSYYSLVGRTV